MRYRTKEEYVRALKDEGLLNNMMVQANGLEVKDRIANDQEFMNCVDADRSILPAHADEWALSYKEGGE
jgi:hypothetical protein